MPEYRYRIRLREIERYRLQAYIAINPHVEDPKQIFSTLDQSKRQEEYIYNGDNGEVSKEELKENFAKFKRKVAQNKKTKIILKD